MRTVKEKYAFNKKRQDKDSFSSGYCFGVTMYRDYPKQKEPTKTQMRQLIDETKQFAKTGDKRAKGVLCGIRDAANERKSRT